MGDGLGVGGHEIVLGVGQADDARAKGRHDGLDEANLLVGRTVLDDDLCSRLGVTSYRTAARPDRRTSAWPSGLTVGPCSEWTETMCTSAGRYLSKARRSGSLTDV
jgi:hypothetical protein